MENKEQRTGSIRNSALKDSSFLELHKLEQNVNEICHRNKLKYVQIICDEPSYNVVLYEPNDKLKTEKAFRK